MSSRPPSAKRLLVLLAALAVLVLAAWTLRRTHPPAPGAADPQATRALLAKVTELERQENEVAERVWGPELVAQRHGAAVDALWDAVNRAEDRLAVFGELTATRFLLPRWKATEAGPQGMEMHRSSGAPLEVDQVGWSAKVKEWAKAGWHLERCEFRHLRFSAPAGENPVSVLAARGDLTNAVTRQVGTLAGIVQVRWGNQVDAEGAPLPEAIDAHDLTWCARKAVPAFEVTLERKIAPPQGSHFIDPLMVYDLDRDGVPEIILASANLLFRRQPDGSYREEPLCEQAKGLPFTAVLGDFDGDGFTDLLTAVFDGLLLYHGTAGGRFPNAPELVWTAEPRLKYGQMLTAGDIDRDGDLDLWLGQYKNPYERGQMPTPYFDANDGNPSWLLLNDGHGQFSDATAAAGLAAKRHRRSYSGSFVDIDGDGQLDLLVVSDFAGAELYRNDGRGHFTDMTERWLPESHGFGMAHALADFNLDGRLDLLVMGMHCPTASRLEGMGLRRAPDHPNDAMRGRMIQGSRLYFAQPSGGWREEAAGEALRHSGWAWGSVAFDADNDGWPDVFIANGHETHESVRDYESQFWLHDIYVGDSRDDPVRNTYFAMNFTRTRGHGWSYGGYDINRLYLNQSGTGFLEAGHPLGVALQVDSRNAVASDLDGDGRVDLLVTTFETWPKVQQTLRVYRNNLPAMGHWIGFRFKEEGPGASPLGLNATLRWAGRTTTRQLVTGDSHRAQHPLELHFGLGNSTQVDSVEFKWVNGRSLKWDRPTVDTWHGVSATGPPPSAGR